MNFKDRFPILQQFFGGYFPDSDFDNLSDEDVVKSYLQIGINNLPEMKNELELLILNIDSFWEDVGSEANRYFEEPVEAFHWLVMIKKELERNQ